MRAPITLDLHLPTSHLPGTAPVFEARPWARNRIRRSTSSTASSSTRRAGP